MTAAPRPTPAAPARSSCRDARGLSQAAGADRTVSRASRPGCRWRCRARRCWSGCGEAGVDLGTIGLFALVGTPYTIKFLWAPIVDALDVPILSPSARSPARLAGFLAASADRRDRPARVLRSDAIALACRASPPLLVATASATQDIVIDAFRIESLPESEQAAGMASYVAAYRIGMLASTAGALFLVDRLRGSRPRQDHRPGRPVIWRWLRWSSSVS